jgi:hypothetical protein
MSAAYLGDAYIGHAIAHRWTADGDEICWITQLVVHGDYRSRGVATALLEALRDDGIFAYGIMSSHPHAVMAAAKAFSGGSVGFDFVRDSAVRVMEASPVGYVREAKLCGRVFDETTEDGCVCAADTRFFVDHEEPRRARQQLQEREREWVFGELPEGDENLLIVKGKGLDDGLKRQH